MKDFFENVAVSMTVCDLEGKVIYQNVRAVEALGEARGNNLQECHQPSSWDKIQQMLREGTTNAYTIEKRGVRKLIYTPEIFAVELSLNGEKKMAVLKDIQFHPVKDTILHMDFLEVNDKKPVTIEVPVKLEGLAAGVRAGGKLSLVLRKLKVKAIYTQIPEILVVNVENLELGKTIKAGELSYEGLQIMNNKDNVVVAVQLTRAARGAQAAANKK